MRACLFCVCLARALLYPNSRSLFLGLLYVENFFISLSGFDRICTRRSL